MFTLTFRASEPDLATRRAALKSRGVMELEEADEFIALRSAVRALAEKEIAGASPLPDRSGVVPLPAITALAAMGLSAPRHEDDGGQGIPATLEWTAIAEELGRGDAGTALDVVLGAFATIIVGRCGTAAQRARAVPSDTVRGTLLYFEGFGRSPLELETTARPGIADRWVLTGRKATVVRSKDSDIAVVIALLGGAPRAFLLTGKQLAASVPQAAVSAAPVLGARAAQAVTIELAEVADAELLGEADIDPQGVDVMVLHRCIAAARLAVASIALGTGDTAIRYAASYASTRQAFGRTISAFQGVAFPLVDAELAIEAARLAIHDLAVQVDSATDRTWLADATAQAVAAANEAGCFATATAVNTLGGHGYLTDHPVERWYRDAAALASVDFDPLLTDWSATR